MPLSLLHDTQVTVDVSWWSVMVGMGRIWEDGGHDDTEVLMTMVVLMAIEVMVKKMNDVGDGLESRQ